MKNKIERASFSIFKRREAIMHKVTQCIAMMLFATAALGGCATQSRAETLRKETV